MTRITGVKICHIVSYIRKIKKTKLTNDSVGQLKKWTVDILSTSIFAGTMDVCDDDNNSSNNSSNKNNN